MPTIFVAGPALDTQRRAQLVREVTDAVVHVHSVRADKVHLFYTDADGVPTISVHLVGSPRPDNDPLVQAIRSAASCVPVFSTAGVHVKPYAPDHTAKNGELRGTR